MYRVFLPCVHGFPILFTNGPWSSNLVPVTGTYTKRLFPRFQTQLSNVFVQHFIYIRRFRFQMLNKFPIANRTCLPQHHISFLHKVTARSRTKLRITLSQNTPNHINISIQIKVLMTVISSSSNWLQISFNFCIFSLTANFSTVWGNQSTQCKPIGTLGKQANSILSRIALSRD